MASPAARLGRRALLLTAASVGLTALTAALGTSAAVVPLPQGAFPLEAGGHPSAWTVSGLLGAAVLAAVAAVWTGWRALDAGWAPSPRRLLAAAFVAAALLAVVPPVAGADVLSYAAYGHIAARGLDPFRVAPDSLAGDPIAQAVEAPWRGTPSVYGPLAAWEQEALVHLAGNRLRPAVGLLDLVNAAAFATAAFLLYLLAGPGDDARRRAVVTFGLNPLLLFVVVAGGHLDALAVALLVAGLLAFKRSPLGAGLLGGAAVLVKLTAGLPLAGWAWVAGWGRGGGSRGRVALLVAGAAAAAGAGYAAVGLHALNQARRASRLVSVGTPWRPVRAVLQALAGHGAASAAVSAASLALAIWLVVALARSLPAAEDPDGVTQAARAGLAVALAWALAAPYVLAWYDAIPWALTALMALRPVSRTHRILLAHTGMLALAYLPGRVVPLPGVLDGISIVLRSGVCPAVLAACIVLTLGSRLRVQRKTSSGPQAAHSRS